MAKKKSSGKEESPEKVESAESEKSAEAVQSEVSECAHDADLAKHPKFDKFKSHGGN